MKDGARDRCIFPYLHLIGKGKRHFGQGLTFGQEAGGYIVILDLRDEEWWNIECVDNEQLSIIRNFFSIKWKRQGHSRPCPFWGSQELTLVAGGTQELLQPQDRSRLLNE